jgi:N-acetylglutamate synthase-like GNAT family acetyltransferase
MGEYYIRKATLKDVPFLAEVIVAAEKGNTGNMSYSTLFNLTESKVEELIIAILGEEIDGCEFSLSSYLVTEFDGKPVAALGGWIEGFEENTSSKILKSNLISFIFPKESIQALISNSNMICDILIDREMMTLQLEYGYILKDHRGKKLLEPLIHKHVENALSIYPDLKKVQFQCFKNTTQVVHLFEKLGYYIAKEVHAKNEEVSNFLPDRVKLLMEKIIK